MLPMEKSSIRTTFSKHEEKFTAHMKASLSHPPQPFANYSHLLTGSRQGVSALRDGSQQVSVTGLGLPDDGARLNSGGRHRACAPPQLRPAQPRFPETAQSSGHHTARGEAKTKTRNDARSTVVIGITF